MNDYLILCNDFEICNEFALDYTYFFNCIQFYVTGGCLVPHYAISYLTTNRANKTGKYAYHNLRN